MLTHLMTIHQAEKIQSCDFCLQYLLWQIRRDHFSNKASCSCRVSAKSKFIAVRVPAIRHVLTKDLSRDACRSR